MARPLRDTDPSKVHIVSTRTLDAALWMIPSDELNRILGGILARYQEIFSIVIYAYIFNGNHYHLLVKAPFGHLDEFIENVNREIARRVNRMNRRRSQFWGRRYDDLVVLTVEDELEALLYVVTNSTHHGLISHPNKYPGLGCYDQLLDEQPRTYQFTHYARRIKTAHTLRLTPLSQLEGLAPNERRATMIKLINERVREIHLERAAEGKGFMSAAALRRQIPGSIPVSVSSSARPPAYSKNAELLREEKIAARLLRAHYDDASARYRAGDANVEFPQFTFKPPLHRAPRAVPFGHLMKAAA